MITERVESSASAMVLFRFGGVEEMP